MARRSIRAIASMSACWTLTATSRPSASRARWTWASDALATGASSNAANSASGPAPSSSRTRARTASGGPAGTRSCKHASSSRNGSGRSWVRTLASWPALMNRPRSLSTASRTRRPFRRWSAARRRRAHAGPRTHATASNQR